MTPNDNKNRTTTTTIAIKNVYIVTTVAILMKQYGAILLNFASVLFNLAVKAHKNKFGNLRCFEYFWLDLFFAC